MDQTEIKLCYVQNKIWKMHRNIILQVTITIGTIYKDNIKYFDCVYDIIEENPEMYNQIKFGDFNNLKRRFRFFPSVREIIARREYFIGKRRKYPTRTDDRLYQDELVETLNMRFNKCMTGIKLEVQ